MKIISRKGIRTIRRYSSLENPIYEVESPDFLKIPFPDCSMEDFTPRYSEGDYVPQYGLLGTNNDGFGIYAPNCGRYEGVEYSEHEILGKTLVINFTVEHGMSANPFKPTDSTAPDSDEVVFIAKRAGIIDEIDNVPLYQKLLDIREKKIGVLIADAIEDECYETSCFAQLIEQGDEIGKGIELAAIACGVWDYKIAVTVPREYSKGIRKKYGNAEVVFAEGKYPVHHAVKEGFGKKTVEFIGAGACAQLCKAMDEGSCQTTCVVTVDGDCVRRPANLRVAIGTPVSYLIEACRLLTEPKNIIIGDMLNGRIITDPTTPVLPSMKCILAMNTMLTSKTHECTKCGRCANDCPQNLLPFKLMGAIEKGNNKLVEELQISKCIECGVCSLVCPSGIDVKSVIAATRAGIDYREFNTIDSYDEYEAPVSDTDESKAVEAAVSEPETVIQTDDIPTDTDENTIDAMEVLGAINEAESEENEQLPDALQTRYTYTPLHDEGIDDLVESIDISNTVVSVDDEYEERDYSEYLNLDFGEQDNIEASSSNDDSIDGNMDDTQSEQIDFASKLTQMFGNFNDIGQETEGSESISSDEPEDISDTSSEKSSETDSADFVLDLEDMAIDDIYTEEDTPDQQEFVVDIDDKSYNPQDDFALEQNSVSPDYLHEDAVISAQHEQDSEVKDNSGDSSDDLFDFDSFFKSINEDIEKSNKALQQISDIMSFSDDFNINDNSEDIDVSSESQNQGIVADSDISEDTDIKTSNFIGYDFMAHAGLSFDENSMRSFENFIGKSQKPTTSNDKADELYSVSENSLDNNTVVKTEVQKDNIAVFDAYEDSSNSNTDDFFDYILRLNSSDKD